jgi:hypothetical protein
MSRTLVAPCVLAFALLAGACARHSNDSPAEAPAAGAAGVAGQANRAGSFLAYEHRVELRLPGADIAPRVSAVRAACMEARFGECVVLAEEQGAGEFPHGELKVRAVPAAIGKLVDLAADGAELAQRSTVAEDLAEAVHDNELRQRRLKLQHERLLEFAARPDGKLEDLLAVNERLAALEADLQQAEQQAAQDQRRLDTNLLTLRFDATGVTTQSSRTMQALRGMADTWDATFGVLVSTVGVLLPFVALGLLAWFAVRVQRRWRAKRA